MYKLAIGYDRLCTHIYDCFFTFLKSAFRNFRRALFNRFSALFKDAAPDISYIIHTPAHLLERAVCNHTIFPLILEGEPCTTQNCINIMFFHIGVFAELFPFENIIDKKNLFTPAMNKCISRSIVFIFCFKSWFVWQEESAARNSGFIFDAQI